ncbi:MAG: DUF2809 domain-containing protein [Woeseiaceae bacterium]
MLYALLPDNGQIISNTRTHYSILTMATMLLGLASRADALGLPPFVGLYVGDSLWALMIFWCVRFLSPSMSSLRSVLIALGFAFGIEFLQLYQAPWINAIRATTLGGLVLGFGFKVSDLVSYLIGVGIGYGLCYRFGRRRSQ